MNLRKIFRHAFWKIDEMVRCNFALWTTVRGQTVEGIGGEQVVSLSRPDERATDEVRSLLK